MLVLDLIYSLNGGYPYMKNDRLSTRKKGEKRRTCIRLDFCTVPMGVNAGKFQSRVKSQKRFTIQYDSALPLKKKEIPIFSRY
jgi:hypothetical protein